MTSRLILCLTGDNARLGELYATDLARLLSGIDRAVGRTAAQLAGRPSGTAGPLPQTISDAVKLRLTAIGDGSVVLELAPPEASSSGETTEPDSARLAESAISTVINVLDGSETEFSGTTAALSQLAEDLGVGQRYEALSFVQPGDTPHEAVLDGPVRTRLAAATRQRTRNDEDGSLVGFLYEADFEKRRAKVRTVPGSSVTVHFSDDHAQDIKKALREKSRLRGRITYNEETSAMALIELTEIAPLERSALTTDSEQFWARRSLDELAKAQGVGIVESVEVLQDDTISDEEAEAFIAALEL